MVQPQDETIGIRALTLIYHEDFEPQITGVIREHMVVARYTRIKDVIGARTDIIQESDFIPQGTNNMLIVVATKPEVEELAGALRQLRQYLGHGLRGYITTVEGLI